MSKYIKSTVWSLLVVITYMFLQLLATKIMGEGIFRFEPDYSDPKTWGRFIFVKQINTNLIKVIPIVISMLIYYILYKLILKEKVTTNYGFSKAGAKNIFIGILMGFFTSLLCSLILTNQVWNELIYRKEFLNLLKLFKNHDILVIARNTLLVNIISIITMVLVIPFFEEILLRGLVFNKLRTAIPVWIAIVLQAILFGVLQGNVLSAVYAFIIGLLLGITYMITQSIWIPILIHTILNITNMAIKEVDKLSIFLGPSTFNTTEVIDTFVYKSIIGAPYADTKGMPLVLNVILGAIMSLFIVLLIIWLWKSNSRHKNYFCKKS